MRYFSFIPHSLMLKKKLDKAVSDFLYEKNRLVIEAEDLEKYKEEVINGIEVNNKMYSRCKPIKATWWNHRDNEWQLSVGFLTLCLHAAKN